MSTLYFILFIVGGLLIVAYPMILVVNIMALSGYQPKTTPRSTMVAMKAFLWSTTLYPITYFFALYKYRNTAPEAHYIWAGIVVVHLVLIYIAYKGWTTMEKDDKRRRSASMVKK